MSSRRSPSGTASTTAIAAAAGNGTASAAIPAAGIGTASAAIPAAGSGTASATIPAAGGCLCGEIRYRITAAPMVTSYCHCRSCRLATGAPAAAWVILPRDGLVFDRGTPVGFASSPGKLRTFCGHCGTSLTYERDDRPDSIDIHTATLDDPDTFPPLREIWLEEKIAWMEPNPRFAHYPRTSGG